MRLRRIVGLRCANPTDIAWDSFVPLCGDELVGAFAPLRRVHFVYSPKQNEPKQTAPVHVALRVPCARARMKAVGLQHVRVLEAHAGDPSPAPSGAWTFIRPRARRRHGVCGAKSTLGAIQCRVGRAQRNPPIRPSRRIAPHFSKGTTFPGFRLPSGSSARLSRRIKSTSTSDL